MLFGKRRGVEGLLPNPTGRQSDSESHRSDAGIRRAFIYIAFHCYDDPEKVRATVTKRQHLNDEKIGILSTPSPATSVAPVGSTSILSVCGRMAFGQRDKVKISVWTS
jgi:hypothetical protein